jgi:hypothetical protein
MDYGGEEMKNEKLDGDKMKKELDEVMAFGATVDFVMVIVLIIVAIAFFLSGFRFVSVADFLVRTLFGAAIAIGAIFYLVTNRHKK